MVRKRREEGGMRRREEVEGRGVREDEEGGVRKKVVEEGRRMWMRRIKLGYSGVHRG